MADDADTERVTFTIANLRTINSKRLYALVDVELQVAALSFRIIGVQIRRGIGEAEMAPVRNLIHPPRRR
jgi:hypothetical protein